MSSLREMKECGKRWRKWIWKERWQVEYEAKLKNVFSFLRMLSSFFIELRETSHTHGWGMSESAWLLSVYLTNIGKFEIK